MLKYILILLSLSMNPLLSNGQDTYVVNDKEEYKKLLKLYNDSLEAHENDPESQLDVDWVKDRGFRVSSVKEYKKYYTDGKFLTHPNGTKVYKLFYKETQKQIAECVCKGYYTKRDFVSIFKKPTHKPVYEAPKFDMVSIKIISVDELVTDPQELILLGGFVKIPDLPKIDFVRETFNEFSTAGYPRYDRDSGSWVIIEDGYEQQWEPFSLKGK
jgi:hypothetical protein